MRLLSITGLVSCITEPLFCPQGGQRRGRWKPQCLLQSTFGILTVTLATFYLFVLLSTKDFTFKGRPVEDCTHFKTTISLTTLVGKQCLLPVTSAEVLNLITVNLISWLGLSKAGSVSPESQ